MPMGAIGHSDTAGLLPTNNQQKLHPWADGNQHATACSGWAARLLSNTFFVPLGVLPRANALFPDFFEDMGQRSYDPNKIVSLALQSRFPEPPLHTPAPNPLPGTDKDMAPGSDDGVGGHRNAREAAESIKQ